MTIPDILNYDAARAEHIGIVRNLLLGPLEENEILREVAVGAEPTDFYLTGILWPRNVAIGAAEDEKSEEADTKDADPSDDTGAPLFSILKPSSIGVTCTVKGENTPFEIRIRGARYIPQTSECFNSQQQLKEDNHQKSLADYTSLDWERKAFEYHLYINNDESRTQWKTQDFVTGNGEPIIDTNITVHIRRRLRKGSILVTASLINTSERPEGHTPGPYCIYQAEIELISMGKSGDGNIIARSADAAVPDDDVAMGDLLYRKFHEYAVGHGIAATWQEPVEECVTAVKTDWIPLQPVYSVSRTGNKNLLLLANCEDSPFRATFLSSLDKHKDIISGLTQFCDIYKNWIDAERERISFLPQHLQATATRNLSVCDGTLDRIREGVKLLETDDLVFKAFCLANEAMNAQATGRQRGEQAKPLKWFPFQLAFILLNLPSLVDGRHSARNTMDLLWFPTGGGKTEAYLGLTAFTIFYRRLKLDTKVEPHVDVIMRYTLRLLTVQQFQRAAALICAADIIRRNCREDLGDTPISIGLYVGEGATPNKLVEGSLTADGQIKEEQNAKEPSSTPRLLLSCPLCGTDLSPFCYNLNHSVPTLEIICQEKTCPSEGRPLPVFTVDEDIYRNRPSLIIGTVDKFAQLPRKEDQGLIFGRPGGIHPELIIQDELHLISGPLGTVTGLYEVCIDLLCSYGSNPPKIIGSTATIGRAREQVKALFDRDVLQFPPPALDADDSFFSVIDKEAPNRLYVGISSVGRSPKFTLQAITAASLAASQALQEKGFGERSVDPYWTLLLYFNSLRELGGAKVMMQDDVPRSNEFFSTRLGTGLRLIESEPSELTSRVPSTKIPKILKELEKPLGGNVYEGDPVDIIVASNMVSVGMDISRLGLMIVYGQPKSTSEYIQATSRIGRLTPGLVFTVLNAARPRDMSHFEHFVHYHQTLYRRVEVTSVTPWSSRARDKALHAVFIAAVRHLVPGMSGRFGAVDFNPLDPVVIEIRDWIVRRAGNSPGVVSSQDIKDELNEIISRWAQRAKMYRGNKRFEYWATSRPYDHRPVNPHLMRGAEDLIVNSEVWPTPNSMRDVEPSSYYVLTTKNNS